MRALIVDDEQVARVELERLLAADFQEVVCYRDPREGLGEAISNEFDVIFVDVMMPYMDGFDFVKQYRSSCPDSSAKIFLLTAQANEFNEMSWFDQFQVVFLPKPFDRDKIQHALNLAESNVVLSDEPVERA